MSATVLRAEAGEPEETEGVVELEERRTDELVIAFVGAVGSGVSKSAAVLSDIMARDYKYEVNKIRVSDIIRESAEVNGIAVPDNTAPRHKIISELQNAGNELRRKFSVTYLADKAVERIAVDRQLKGGYKSGGDGYPLLPVKRRRVHIIDSLKHPDEVHLLRDVYGDTFWLIMQVRSISQRRCVSLQQLRCYK